METLFAEKAEPGHMYETLKGMFVRVLGIDKGTVKVESLSTGNVIRIEPTYLLRPCDEKKLEEITMAKMQGKVSTEAIASRVEEAGKKELSRVYLEKKYVVVPTKDGFKYSGKLYRSLTDVARTITGQKIINGPKFFGLRQAVKGGK